MPSTLTNKRLERDCSWWGRSWWPYIKHEECQGAKKSLCSETRALNTKSLNTYLLNTNVLHTYIPDETARTTVPTFWLWVSGKNGICSGRCESTCRYRFCLRCEVAKFSNIVISITDYHDSIIYHDLPTYVIDDLPARLSTVPDMIALLQTMWNTVDILPYSFSSYLH